MKKSTLSFLLSVATGLLCLMALPGAHAATSWSGSWSYSSCGNTASSTVSWGNSYTCADTIQPANATMNMSGWSSDLSPVTNFAQAAVYPWGSSAGFGIVSKEECNFSTAVCDPGTGPHAADNLGNLDAFLLKFASSPSAAVSVALNQIQVGWNGNDACSPTNCTYDDADVSVYYYAGPSAPSTSSITGMSASTLSAATTSSAVNGWKLLGHYPDAGKQSGNTLQLNNTSGISSSWWLVTASNQTTGTTTTTDAFKLLSVAGTGTNPPPSDKVPEPSSLALAVLALFGLIQTRRHSKGSKR